MTMSPSLAHASIHSPEQAQPPPSYTPRNHQTPKPDSSFRKLKLTVLVSVLTSIASMALIVILMISGTRHSGNTVDSSILLEDYYIITIPIKYEFLCARTLNSGGTISTCPPRWKIMVYLNGVWAYDEQSISYFRAIFPLWKGAGHVFDLTAALTIMDDTIPLGGIGGIGQNYTTPTDTAMNAEMTTVGTLAPFVLFILGLIIPVLFFFLLFLEACLSRRKPGFKILRKRFILIMLFISVAVTIAAAVYINRTASLAAKQIDEDYKYFSGPSLSPLEPGYAKPHSGKKCGNIFTMTILLQVVSFGCYAGHCWIEKKANEEKAKAAATTRTFELQIVPGQPTTPGTESVYHEDPPAYTEAGNDLESIRMTEHQALESRRVAGTV